MQSELFEELPCVISPSAKVEIFRLPGGQEIPVKVSKWADGRIIFDLTPMGGEQVRSRNHARARECAINELTKLREQTDRAEVALKQALSSKPIRKIRELEHDNENLRKHNQALVEELAKCGSQAEPPRIPAFRFHVLLIEKLGSLLDALVLQHVAWLLQDERNGRLLKDGHRWIYNTYEQWRENHFKFASVPNLKRSFRRLEKGSFLISTQPDGRASRRKYYRLGPEGIKMIRSIGSELASAKEKFYPFRNSSKPVLPNSTNTTTTSSTTNMTAAAAVSSVNRKPTATTAAEPIRTAEEAIKEFQPHFPHLDVREEFKKCEKYRKSHGLPTATTLKAFKAWLNQAQVALSPLKSKPKAAPQPFVEEVDPAVHAGFLEALAAWKAKKAATAQQS